MMTKAVTRAEMAEEGSSNDLKPTCVFFKKNGKCHRASCELKYSHTMNTEEKGQHLKENGSGDSLNLATKPSPEESREFVSREKMASSQVKRDGRPNDGVNEDELRESLKCELMEKCTSQLCFTCQETFPSQDVSKAHYAGKPHQRMLEMKLKVLLRKKISQGNLRKILANNDDTRTSEDCEFVKSNEDNSRKIHGNSKFATEIKQGVTVEMSGDKNCTKEESRKRPGDHLDEVSSLSSILLEKCLPTYCGICSAYLNQNNFSAHYTGKPHKKKLKLMEREQNPNNYICSMCRVTSSSKEDFDIHCQGSKHKSKEAQQGILGSHIGPAVVKTKQLSGPVTFSCDVCHISCSSEFGLKMHLAGKSHAKTLKYMNNAGFICEICEIERLDSRSLELHFQGFEHRARVVEMQQRNKSRFEEAYTQVKENREAVVAVEVEKPFDLEAEESPPDMESINMQSTVMMKENTSEKSVIKDEGLDDILDISELSYAGESVQENKVEDMENNFAVKSESVPMQVAVTVKEKTGDTQSIPDLSDSVIMNLKQLKDIHKEFMSMQAEEMMFGNTSEESVIKDEEMDKTDNTNAEDIPELSDSPISKVGHSETDTEPMSVKAKDDSEEKDVPDLCDSMSDLAGHSDLVKNNELKIKLNLKYKELLHPPEIDKSLRIGEVVSVTEEAIEVKKSVKDGDEKEASSDDDLIILENPDSSSPKKPVQNTPKLNNTPVVESVKLCVYPLGQSESVTVSTQDYATLAYDTYLNDIIIDFYLLYLSKTVLPNADKENVHIFSTMFYKRLLQKPGQNAKKVPDYETDSSLTSAEIRHFRVASWTKNVDLFKKDMIIIPICEESHWYLLIVVRPGAIFLPVKERRKKGEPFVIVLDSVGGKNGTAVKNMRRYLACEWNKKKCHGVESLTKLEEIGKSMNTVRPNKPEQENNSDCGIFLLQYVENVFQNVSAFLWPFLVNSRSKEWFTSEEVGGKRGEIAQLIKRLTEEQKPGEVIEYPVIKFTEKGS